MCLKLQVNTHNNVLFLPLVACNVYKAKAVERRYPHFVQLEAGLRLASVAIAIR